MPLFETPVAIEHLVVYDAESVYYSNMNRVFKTDFMQGAHQQAFETNYHISHLFTFGNIIATGSKNGQVSVWDVDKGMMLIEHTLDCKGAVTAMVDNDISLYIGTETGFVYDINWMTGEVFDIHEHNSPVRILDALNQGIVYSLGDDKIPGENKKVIYHRSSPYRFVTCNGLTLNLVYPSYENFDWENDYDAPINAAMNYGLLAVSSDEDIWIYSLLYQEVRSIRYIGLHFSNPRLCMEGNCLVAYKDNQMLICASGLE